MKFINYLQSITGIAIFPLVSLIIFVVFFIGVTLYAYGGSKKSMDNKAHLPLES